MFDGFVLDTARWLGLELIVLSGKSTLVLAVALALTTAFRSRLSARARYGALSIALFASLAMPLVGAALPDLEIARWPLPPLANREVSVEATPPVKTGSVDVMAPWLEARGATAPEGISIPGSEAIRPETESASRPDRAGAFLLTALSLWGLGVLVGLARVFRSWRRWSALAARARPPEDARWENEAARCARLLSIDRPPPLRIAADAVMPMAGGVLSPTLLLPAQVGALPASRRRAILLHELVHVKRRDPLRRLLEQCARAFQWFNPVLWLAVRRLEAEREQSCDEVVLSTGAESIRYAEDLLAIAARFRASPVPGMARASGLDARLRAILAFDAHGRRSSRPLAATVFGLTIALVLVLSAATSGGEDRTPRVPAEEKSAAPEGVAAAAGTIPNPDRLGERLDAFVRPYVERGIFSGTILVGAGEYALFSKSYGWADETAGVPNGFDTKYRIASLSKQFTMAAIGAILDDGALTPQSTLSEFLPDFPEGQRITIEHLLGHRSGIPHTNRLDWMEDAPDITLDEIVEGLRREPLDFEPGTARRYSNGGYAVLAKVIEVASGSTYGEFLDERVFAPLELRHTGEVRAFEGVDGAATGYLPGPRLGESTPARPYPAQNRIGGGSLYSRAEDVWHLFRKTYQHRMHSDETATYLFGDREQSGEVTGRSPGFAAKVYLDLPQDVVIVSLANNYSFLGPWARSLYRVVMEVPEERADLDFATSKVPAERAGFYAGRYEFAGGTFTIERDAEGDLVYRDGENDWHVVLAPLADGNFYMPFYDRICEFKGESRADSILYHSRVVGDENPWAAPRVAGPGPE